MKKVLLGIVLLSILMTASASGFDGNRKGFVLGGGLGFSPLAKYSFVDPIFNTGLTIEEEKTGVALQFVIGYGWDEQNLIVYEGNVVGYCSDYINKSMAQGFNGASWFHYYGLPGKSIYTTVGLGFYVFDVEDFDANDPGIGVLLGVGYEFSKHWQFGCNLGFGKTSDHGVDFEHTHISVMFSGIAF